LLKKVILLMFLAACSSTASPQKKVLKPDVETTAISPENEYKNCAKYDKKGDYDMALACYTRLADGGYQKAYLGLAKAYEYGNGVKKNTNKAMRYYEKAAEGGTAEAAMRLASEYSNGAIKNDAKAFKWYKKAAENGNASAAFALSHMYAAGKGITKSEENSKYWLTISAANGFPHAQYLMGSMEYNRYQMNKDAEALTKAKMWLQKAAGQGNSDAKKMLKTLPIK